MASTLEYVSTARISNIGAPSTTLGGPVTIPNVEARVLIVFVHWNSGSVSSVTFNGVAMQYTGYTALLGAGIGAYILVNPPIGIYTLQVTTSSSATIVMDAVLVKGGQVASGSFDALDTGAIQSNITGGSSIATNITANTDKVLIIAAARGTGTIALGGSGFTQRTAANNIILATSNGPIDRRSVATLTTTYTPSGSTNGHVLISVRPSGNNGGIIGFM